MSDNFLIKSNEQVGRYAIASKSLEAGETIFEEIPFAYGPKSEHPPMCLGCYLPVDCTYLCTTCGWPVCKAECERIEAHRDYECQVFSKANVKFQLMDDSSDVCLQYECITPLRVLLGKEKFPERWNAEISEMQSHNEKRKALPIWQFYQTNVVDYLRNRCQMKDVSEELIHSICGILDVNAFEAHTSNAGYSIRCLYPKLAILSHNCVSNITHTIIINNHLPDEKFKVVVRAAIKVNEGDELYSSYTYALMPTLIRRQYLMESKYFECACRRCCDPTELGTHMGTLKCTKCDNGIILSQRPLDMNADWKCTHCAFQTKGNAVAKLYQIIQNELDHLDDTICNQAEAIEQRERVYRKYRSIFHPRNTYHTLLRLALAQMYGKCEGYQLDDLPDLLLERKIELCQQVLQNLDIIEPGLTRTRATLLYELHAPLILLARNLYRSASIDKKELRGKLNEAIQLLKEAALILSFEPLETAEGQLGLGARQALTQLEENIDDLVNAEF